MSTPDSVLIPCGGKWVGMVQHVARAMREVEPLRTGEVVVADAAAVTPAGCFAGGSVVVPRIDEPSYVDAIEAACVRFGIRVVLPLIDLDLVRLAPHAERLLRVGATLVAPPPELTALCMDKGAFFAFAQEAGLHPPRLVDDLDAGPYPLFHKRKHGFGSIGAGRVADPDAAKRAKARDPALLFFECIDGPELSVDCFIEAGGRCTVAVQRVREKVVGGEAWMSLTVRETGAGELARKTVAALAGRGLRGPLNVQLFGTEPARIIEVNTRLGSASIFSNFACGGRLIRSVLAQACGLPVDGDPDDYRADLQHVRFLGDVMHDGSTPLLVGPDGPLAWP